ncbi:MAG TPA: hypothetical protein VFM71_00535 [Gemmatimonadaceae bacterium]|nr:hypothetical protein [Gemmatimonadaceae bacterium]
MSKTRNTRRLVFALALGALGGLSLPMAVEAQEPTPPRAVRGGDRVVEREAVRVRRDAVRRSQRRAQVGARVMRVRQARGQGMARARQSGVSATALLNARRRLELTPRQVMQLDSIERTQVAARRANAERMRATMRAGRDTTQATAQARAERRRAMREMTTEQREAMRTAMRDSMEARREAMRPEMERMRAADSTARAAAERVLTDAQRQELRVMQAEARGRAQGHREALRSRGGRRP